MTRTFSQLPGFGLILAAAYMVGGLIWLILANIGVGLIAVALHFASGHTEIPADPMDLLPGWLAAIGYGVGLGGVIAWGAALVWISKTPFQSAFATRMPPLRAWPIALALGLTVGFFPGWLAELALFLFPSLENGTLSVIDRLLRGGAPWENAMMLVAVVIAAPLLEEMLFRGLLWEALSRHLPSWVVWVGTSLAFAIWHLDPLQSFAVFFTGLFLGAIRWTSGSLWPAVLVHLGNNALAAAGTYYGSENEAISWYLGLLGLLASVLLVVTSRASNSAEN